RVPHGGKPMTANATDKMQLFSIGRQDWQTPPEFFEMLDDRFGFTIDGAAHEGNALCDLWYGPGGVVEDAFDADALNVANEVIYCIRSYQGIYPWPETFVRWASWGAHVVALLPDMTSSRWFHEHVIRKAREISFANGRLALIDPATG